MDLRQLASFVAVAEELHFGRAATRLHLSVSGLSQQIRALERQVGVPLLRRASTGAELTAAGVELLAHARTVIHTVEVALAATRRAHGGGLSGRSVLLLDADLAPLLDEALADFALGNPGVDLRTEILGDRMLRERTSSSGDWQLALSWTRLPGTVSQVMAHLPVAALLRRDHPLVGRHPGALPRTALTDWPLVLFHHDEAPELHDQVMMQLGRSPSAPMVSVGPVHGPALPATVRTLIAEVPDGVTLVPAAFFCADDSGTHLVTRALAPALRLPVRMNRPAAVSHPVTAALVTHLRQAWPSLSEAQPLAAA